MALRGVPLALRAFQRLKPVPFALRAFKWSEAADNSVYLFQDKTGCMMCFVSKKIYWYMGTQTSQALNASDLRRKTLC